MKSLYLLDTYKDSKQKKVISKAKVKQNKTTGFL